MQSSIQLRIIWGLMLLCASSLSSGSTPSCGENLSIFPIALSSAIDAAYTGNPQLLSVRQDREKSEAQVIGAMTGFLPSANFTMQGEQYVSYQPGGIPVTVGSTTVGGQQSAYTSYPSVGVNWNLYAGGKDVAAYTGAKANVRASDKDVDRQAGATLIGVLTAYADLLKAQAMTRQLEEAINAQEQILSRSEQRFRQGKDSLLIVNQSRMSLAQNERDYFVGCKTLVEKSAALAQAVGVRLSQVHIFKATSALPSPPVYAISFKDFDALVEQDPAVQAARERVEVAQNKLDQARAAFKPTVSFVARYDALGQNPSNFMDAYHNTSRSGYRLGLVLQQSLGPFTSEYANVESAKADLAKAELAYDAAKIDADAKLRSAWNGKRQTAFALEAAKRSLAHGEELFELTRQNYVQGRMGRDSMDQIKVGLEKEREAMTERLLDDQTQAWLLDQALNPQDFVQRVMMQVGQSVIGGHAKSNLNAFDPTRD